LKLFETAGFTKNSLKSLVKDAYEPSQAVGAHLANVMVSENSSNHILIQDEEAHLPMIHPSNIKSMKEVTDTSNSIQLNNSFRSRHSIQANEAT
jgi:hypothetical protein